MAEQRRRAGYVRDAILRLLQMSHRPLSALELRKMLDGQDKPVAPNLVFRALGELVDRGAIRKILVARGYAPGSGTGTVSLFCRLCGRVTEIACDQALDDIDRAAATRRFAVSRRIVEVAGLCGSCAGPDVQTGDRLDPAADAPTKLT